MTDKTPRDSEPNRCQKSPSTHPLPREALNESGVTHPLLPAGSGGGRGQGEEKPEKRLEDRRDLRSRGKATG